MEIFCIERNEGRSTVEGIFSKVVFSLFGLVTEREKIGHREGNTWKGILQAERIFFGKFLVFFWRGY